MSAKNSAIGAHKIARYGWQPDLPDQRDHFYAPRWKWPVRFR